MLARTVSLPNGPIFFEYRIAPQSPYTLMISTSFTGTRPLTVPVLSVLPLVAPAPPDDESNRIMLTGLLANGIPLVVSVKLAVSFIDPAISPRLQNEK